MPPLSASGSKDASAFEKGRKALEQQFLENQRPNLYLKQHTKLADDFIRALQPESNPWLCCVATGGYGRRQLYPHSDIDLLFLTQDGKPAGDVQHVLQPLWDAGLKVGYAVRTPQECVELSQQDATILTSLLDARYLWGNRSLYRQFRESFKELTQHYDASAFLHAKLDERRARLKKQGESRFLLEPDVKESKGTLRDLHLMHWLASYLYGVQSVNELQGMEVLGPAELRRYSKAHRFLSILRIYLHLLSGRGDDRLSFERQQQIAQAMGYRGDTPNDQVERFMTYYFRTVRDVGILTRLFCAWIEASDKKAVTPWPLGDNLCLHDDRVDFASNRRIEKQPIHMLQLFHTAQQMRKDVHPLAFLTVNRSLNLVNKKLRSNKEANRLFREMLLSPIQPGQTLSRLNESGVLGKFLPDFARLTGQMQFDRYHVYTVDEHILQAVEHLHRMEAGDYQDMLPLGSQLIQEVGSRNILFVAMLTHDIGKGRGGGPHELHEHVAQSMALQLGLSTHEANEVRWLVANHMLFSHTAFSRDSDDPKTLSSFIATVKTRERLRMLLLITVADMLAVGPTIWNPWRNAMLRELYIKSEQALGVPPKQLEDTLRERTHALCEQHMQQWPDILRERFTQTVTTPWLLGLPHDSVAAVLEQLKDYWCHDHETIAFTYEQHAFEGFTRLYFCLHDTPRMLEYICGVMLLIQARIVACRTGTLKDGTVCIQLDIRDSAGAAFLNEEALDTIPHSLREVIDRRFSLKEKLKPYLKRRKPGRQKHQVRVSFDNSLSDLCSVAEIQTTDRPGLLYDITACLASHGLNIVSTHIMTYGDQAVDVLYIKDRFGLKLEHEHKISRLRFSLLTHLMKGNK